MRPFDFLDRVFNRRTPVRVPVNRGRPKHIYRMSEKSTGFLSYVDIKLPTGFVVAYDGNLPLDKLFDRSFYMRRQNDFFVVNLREGLTEIFIVELKSNTRNLHHVVTQLKGGIALLAFCLRHGVDKRLLTVNRRHIKVYAVLLTHTTTRPRGTALSVSADDVDYKEFCSGRSGLVYVENHTVTIEELRGGALPVNVAWSRRNRMEGLLRKGL